MTNPTSDIHILDDDAVAEIEALSAKVPDGPWFVDKDDAEDVPDHRRSGLALVDTGRSADWWIARLCEWHTARFIAESKTNVDALCATVRALRAEIERLKEAHKQIQHRCMCCVTNKECSQAMIDIDSISRKALGNQIHGYKVGEIK